MTYGLVVRPLVVIDYVWVYQDSFTEKNAGVGNLSLKSDGAQALKISGGLVYSRPFAFEIRGRKARLVPEIRGGVVGQLVLGNRNVAASLPGLGGAFTLRGNESAEVRGAAGAGVSLWLEKRLAIFVDYAGEYGDDTRNTRLVGGVRIQESAG